jgi:uncharacterized membrane protein
VEDQTLPPIGRADGVIGFFGTLGVVGLIAAAAWAWPRLPDSVPVHFSFRGEPDGWGPPYVLLVLPAIGVGLYWLLTVVAHHPGLYAHANLSAITPAGRVRQYLLVRQLILALRAFVPLLFMGNLILVTLVATGRLEGLGTWLSLVELVALAVLLVSYVTAALRAR